MTHRVEFLGRTSLNWIPVCESPVLMRTPGVFCDNVTRHKARKSADLLRAAHHGMTFRVCKGPCPHAAELLKSL